jgi:alkylation response protein AidB-like acyl-CoA dehydrogenase
MASTLREHAGDTESQFGMVPENLRDLTDAGVFRLTLPKDGGGFEADITAINEILAQISRGDPSTGWMTAINRPAIQFFLAVSAGPDLGIARGAMTRTPAAADQRAGAVRVVPRRAGAEFHPAVTGSARRPAERTR